jgi:hypothetical protein
MKKVLFICLSFIISNLVCFADSSLEGSADNKPEVAKILYGRKDLIRNQLVDSNNKVFIRVLDAYNGQFQSLTYIVETLRQENVELKKQNAQLERDLSNLKLLQNTKKTK